MANLPLHLASNNCYGVLLNNLASKSDSEVVDIVKPFGKVVEVQRGGPFVFVYFREYIEARKCVNSLASHELYQAKPAKPRESKEKSEREARPCNKEKSQVLRSKSEGRFERSRPTEATKNYAKHTKNKETDGIPINREKLTSNSDAEPNNGPPPVIHIMDLYTNQMMRNNNYAREVVIGNLPVDTNISQLYLLTSTYANVLHITIHDHSPCPYALVHVPTLDDIEMLKNRLNGNILAGKKIFVEAVDKIIN